MTRKKVAVWILGLLAIACLVYFFFARDDETGFNPDGLEKIQLGMSDKDVVNALGRPSDEVNEIPWANPPRKRLIWHERDFSVAVYFDENDRVCMEDVFFFRRPPFFYRVLDALGLVD